ncbi:PIN domain-containing protein [Myxococcota bacterium]|nr:PIN domain-containing protein [Myxococcota bacterium]
MKVLVDTSVWSVALRRARSNLAPQEVQLRETLADLVRDDRAVLIGVVRQELLSGISDIDRFNKIRTALRSIHDHPLTTPDFELAAEAFNTCRNVGIAPTFVDMTLCAAAIRLGIPILTTDKDFERYASVLPLKLFV